VIGVLESDHAPCGSSFRKALSSAMILPGEMEAGKAGRARAGDFAKSGMKITNAHFVHYRLSVG
jgi:hypothetical protein